MAFYKYPKYLNQDNHQEFDKIYTPGSTPTYSEIYRCEGCGHEVVAEKSRHLPPQNHHQHSQEQGQIRWKLVVTPKN